MWTRSSGATDAVRWRVLYDGITSYDQGLESRAEARGAGLDAELEIDPGDARADPYDSAS